jgi:hypothetical protein
MNEDMEKKLDQLLAEMPKRKYDLDAWLAEDETAEFDRIVSEQKKSAKIKPLRRWLAAAACLILIIGIGVTLWPKEEQPTAPLTAKKPELPKPPPDPEKTLTDSVNTIAAPVRSLRTESPLTADKESAHYGQISAPEDPNLHYAALTTTEDSVPYQDPARVDDYIFHLAEHYQVKQGELTCSQPIDSSVVSSVYVFPDKDEINLFSRLLQVACWYDSKAPGYHLNFSQQQFFFELKDMRRQLQYRWIAERINGRILFYSTQAPIGAKESSACYQQYRDELMYQNSINIKNKKI